MKIKYQHRDPQFHLFISTNNTYPLHLHKNVEIAMVLSGDIRVHIDQQEYVLSEGDMAIIFPNQPHGYQTIDHSQILLIFFDASFPGITQEICFIMFRTTRSSTNIRSYQAP